MKRLLLVFSILFWSDVEAQSHSLDGLWRGSFKSKMEAISIPPIPISLIIVRQADSTYFVRTITDREFYLKGNYFHDSIFWHVQINYNIGDSIEMEEIAFLKVTQHEHQLKSKGKKLKDASTEADGGCPQTFRMKIIKISDKQILTGTWHSTGAQCYDYGNIEFEKIEGNFEIP